jgi:uncharacterized YigZ family protein
MTPHAFKAVAAYVQFEPDKIKGSRHIATVSPVTSESDVADLIAGVRAQFPTARHHAYAWRLGVDRQRFRYSDDGEPSGSAGKPILMQIDRLELTRTAVVVSRIFGGTKLGVGGLVRAYGGAAAEALDRSEIIEQRLTATVWITHAYELSNAVKKVLHQARLAPRDAEYGADTRVCVEVPVNELDTFLAAIRGATADRATCAVERSAED